MLVAANQNQAISESILYQKNN